MANGEPIESSIYGCVSDASALTPQLEIKCFWSVHFLWSGYLYAREHESKMTY